MLGLSGRWWIAQPPPNFLAPGPAVSLEPGHPKNVPNSPGALLQWVRQRLPTQLDHWQKQTWPRHQRFQDSSQDNNADYCIGDIFSVPTDHKNSQKAGDILNQRCQLNIHNSQDKKLPRSWSPTERSYSKQSSFPKICFVHSSCLESHIHDPTLLGPIAKASVCPNKVLEFASP